jgi:HEAT repeat protein
MRRALVLVLLGLLAGLARADLDVDALVGDLGSQDVTRRNAAWQRLRNAKDERAIPILLERIDGFDLLGQHYGVMVLESYPPKVVKKTIPKLLDLDSAYLRFSAGFDLYHLGDKRGVPAMVEALEAPDVDLSMRMYMVNRIYALREPRVLAVLRGMLTPGVQPSLLGSVLWALRTDPDASTLAVCRRLLTDDERADARFLAALFLFQAGETQRLGDVVAALATGQVTTIAFGRMRSFLQVGRLSAPPALLEAATALVAADTEPNLLRAVIQFLADARHHAVVPRLQKLVAHENALVSKAVFEALAELGGGFEADALRPLLTGGDPQRRVAAADILRRMDDPSGLEAVIDVLRTGQDAERADAARVLGLFRLRAAVDPLLDALLDDSVLVRGNALRALDLLLRNLFPYRRLDLVAAGYLASDGAAERRAAAARIRAWWDAHRGGDW